MTTETHKSPFPLPVNTTDGAPPEARDLLDAACSKFGFVPNLLGVMANAPALLEGYMALASAFEKSSLSATERQVVLLATSFENGCDYCMAAHSAIASMQRVAPDVVAALRENRPIADSKLQALREFAAEMVRARGWPTPAAAARFTAAGYRPAQTLDVVLGIGVKTLSNYCNHLAATPLDEAFVTTKWSHPGSTSSGTGQ